MSTAAVGELRARFMQVATEHGPDGEHAEVAVFLGYEPITRTADFHQHVTDIGIDWPAVLNEHWSSTEEFLLGTAAGLWGRRSEGCHRNTAETGRGLR
jgi:hypothetical protein